MRIPNFNMLAITLILTIATMSNLTFASIQVAVNPGEKPELGQGYLENISVFIPSKCLDSEISKLTVVKAPSEKLIQSSNKTFDEIVRMFSMSGAVEVDVGIGEVRAEMGAGMAFSETKTSMTIFTTYEYVAGQVMLTAPSLNLKISNPNPSLCGSHYLSSIQYGARLHVGLKINFRSMEDKESFKAKVTLDAKFLKAKFSAGASRRNADFNGTMEVIIIQEGGEKGGRLDEISSDTREKCRFGGNENKDTASRKVEDCFGAYENAMKYAKNDFAQKIKVGNDLEKWSKFLVPTLYFVSSYEESGFTRLISPENANMENKYVDYYNDARELLNQSLKAVAFNRDFINEIIIKALVRKNFSKEIKNFAKVGDGSIFLEKYLKACLQKINGDHGQTEACNDSPAKEVEDSQSGFSEALEKLENYSPNNLYKIVRDLNNSRSIFKQD